MSILTGYFIGMSVSIMWNGLLSLGCAGMASDATTSIVALLEIKTFLQHS